MHEVKTERISEQAVKHYSKRDKVLGQFWTPQEVADFIVSFASKCLKNRTGKACDPACGDGVFLRSLKREGFTPYGIDIDKSLLPLLPEDIKEHVQIADGLELKDENKFDLVVGNPPFSSKYGRVKGSILENFDLGRGKNSQAIEILFLEKFIKLCKPDGVIGIILPHGVFSSMKLRYVRDYIRENLAIIAIFSLPRNIFRNGKTTSKTCVLIGRKTKVHKNVKMLFGVIKDLGEIASKSIKKAIWTHPYEFLYPEFYLDRNPLLDGLPRLREFNVEVKQGRTKYGKERKFSEKGIPFISAKTVTPLGIDFSRDKKFIQPNSPMDYKNAHVRIGDIIFVRVGVGCIGRAAVVTSEEEKGIADDWIYILRVKDDRISPFYLVFWLQTPIIQREIKRLSRGVGTITIPISLVLEIPILIPGKGELEWFEEMYLEMLNKSRKGNVEEANRIKDIVSAKLEEKLKRDSKDK